ncbi:MAG TPA: hypothetical protein VGR80_10170, partial [Steroidobacteraceae bacterium]|nr:hypothetical protein [Steroidobacteraceae bacterium]
MAKVILFGLALLALPLALLALMRSGRRTPRERDRPPAQTVPRPPVQAVSAAPAPAAAPAAQTESPGAPPPGPAEVAGR